MVTIKKNDNITWKKFHIRKIEEKLSKSFSKTDLAKKKPDLACINTHTNMNLYISTDIKMLMSKRIIQVTMHTLL